MNWTQIEGQWHQLLGKFKSQWGKLTDDDLATIAGKREHLVGKVQERYGIVKDDAERQIDAWIAKLSPDQRQSASRLGAGIGEMMAAKNSNARGSR
jgi:uncharacterized protein YjbJ (UPF0337 family)